MLQSLGPKDGTDLLAVGLFVRRENVLDRYEVLYGSENGDFFVNRQSLVGVNRCGNQDGSCGPAGLKGPNLCCLNGHAVATELADCYQPHFVHFTVAEVQVQVR